MAMRRGFYFSLDALLALGVLGVSLFILLGQPHTNRTFDITQQEVRQADSMAESAMQVALQQPLGSALSPAEQEYYIDTTGLTDTDMDEPVMDAIAILWASNETAAAKNLTATFFADVMPERYEYRISLNDAGSSIIYNSSQLPGDTQYIARATRLISGVQRDKPTSGFIARAFLSEATAENEEHVFFGGYVGDGNISANVSLPDLDTVLNVSMEGAVSGPFQLYFNGDNVGNYTPSAENLTADVFQICSHTSDPADCDLLTSGNNLIRINFTTTNHSIGGGFLRFEYNRTTQLDAEGLTIQTEQHRFPGISGVINLHSSFYVPGRVQGARARLHYEADQGELFMTLGNATVFQREVDGEETVTLDNDSLYGNLTAAGLDYAALSNENIPLRLGATRRSLETGEAGAIDAIATTDLSGSMSSQCTGGGGSQCKLESAKNATKQFIDVILDTPDARVGLTGFNDFIRNYRLLSKDNESMKAEVEGYTSNGGTCVGCGIIRSVNSLIMNKLPEPIIGQGSRWRVETGTGADTSWTELGFDDDSWANASMPAGYGGLAVAQLEDADTYRFRKTFDFDKDDWYQPYAYARHTGPITMYLNGEKVYTSEANGTGQYWDTYIGAWANSSGMWHRTTYRSQSNGSAWYFGQEEVNHYATGEVETGNLATHSLDLSDISAPRLTFDHWREMGNSDSATVEVNDGTGWTELAQYSGVNGWSSESLDLSAYATDSVKIRFRFATNNAKGKNDEEDGWVVDNVRVGGFRSNVINRSLLNDGQNVIAVEMATDPQPFENGSVNTTSFTAGDHTNTTAAAAGLELDGQRRGEYVSAPIDAGRIAQWENTSRIDAPAETNVTMRYGVNSSGSWTYHDSLATAPNSRFVRFQAILRSNSTTRTPTVRWVDTAYSSYGTSFDLQLTADEVRTPSMLVVSDGKSNQITDMTGVPDHDGDGDVDATDHAIEAGCRSHEKYKADVHTIAFGDNADHTELNLTAECGGGNFYVATIDNLAEIYQDIAQSIIRASFEGQQITVKEGTVNQTLFPDSYLSFNYTRDTDIARTFGLAQTSPRFGGSVTSPKNGSFDVPTGTTVSDALITSYSSKYWTDRASIRNSTGQFERIFQLWEYGTEYDQLGDPYRVHIPPEKILAGTNDVQIDTALEKDNPIGGSPDNRVIYTVQVDGAVAYGDVFEKSAGGTYTFETINGPSTITVGNASDPWNTSNDALDNATARLISQLDIDNDGIIDVDIDDDSLNIDAQNTGGIEWLWGPSAVSMEVWTDE